MQKTEVNFEMKLVSSLEKVFLDEIPVYRPECMVLTGLKGGDGVFPGRLHDRLFCERAGGCGAGIPNPGVYAYKKCGKCSCWEGLLPESG